MVPKTASLTQLSSSEFNGTHNSDITSSSSTTTTSYIGRQPPTVVTTTIIDGPNLSNDGISPLDISSTLVTTFPFISLMKNTQNSSHNHDGYGTCMSVFYSFST